MFPTSSAAIVWLFLHHRLRQLCFCKKKLWAACDNTNPNAHLMEAAYGYSGSGCSATRI